MATGRSQSAGSLIYMRIKTGNPETLQLFNSEILKLESLNLKSLKLCNVLKLWNLETRNLETFSCHPEQVRRMPNASKLRRSAGVRACCRSRAKSRELGPHVTIVPSTASNLFHHGSLGRRSRRPGVSRTTIFRRACLPMEGHSENQRIPSIEHTLRSPYSCNSIPKYTICPT
jgi:hypothetical protein